MNTKHSHPEYLILAIVLTVALIGLAWVSQNGAGKASEMQLECQEECFPHKATRITTAPEPCEECLNEQITGGFTVAEPKSFGGDIKGIADESAKAFVGRASETEQVMCYTCSCMSEGITAMDENTAKRVCSQNCAGQIVSAVSGQC